MNEELFNKPWARKEDQIEYDPEETVGSYARKMQIKKENELLEKYKPTKEEEEVIKILITPILRKINELKKEINKITLKKEKLILNGKIGFLFRKLVQIKMPQQMKEKDIKNLATDVAVRMDKIYNEKYKTSSLGNKLGILNLEINFLIDQLKKRMK